MDMTPHFPIYLDYGATTPVDQRVVDAMIPWLREHFGNPASRSHAWGWEAEAAVEKARDQVAALINADPREIVWTSGATESDNLAIKGAAQFYKTRGKHLITVKTEHKAVLDTMRELERQGFEVTYLDVQEDGLLDLEQLKAAMRPDTILVSVMFVNNEIGVIQDIAAIGAMCRERGIVFHVDAAQATGKVPIDLAKLPVDLMSLAAHKIYGPKGIGALYVRRKPRVRLEPQIHGGGHERGMRSGTLPTHQIVGLGEAFRLARGGDGYRDRAHPHAPQAAARPPVGHRADVRERQPEQRVPHNLNISFAFVEGESLIMGVKDIAVSSGSACTSACLEPSYVLRALGLGDELAHSILRLTIGRFNTEDEIDYVDLDVKDASPSCASCRRCGRCTRKASTSARSSGQRTDAVLIQERTMAYSDKVIDHYENPRNVGSFDKGDDGRHRHGRRAGLRRRDEAADQGQRETGLIEDAKFKTFGCGSAIASSSLVTEWVKGKRSTRR